MTSFWQYKLYVDIQSFLQEHRQARVGSLIWNWRICHFPTANIFISFRNNFSLHCTLWRHTVLDFCRHQ